MRSKLYLTFGDVLSVFNFISKFLFCQTIDDIAINTAILREYSRTINTKCINNLKKSFDDESIQYNDFMSRFGITVLDNSNINIYLSKTVSFVSIGVLFATFSDSVDEINIVLPDYIFSDSSSYELMDIITRLFMSIFTFYSSYSIDKKKEYIQDILNAYNVEQYVDTDEDEFIYKISKVLARLLVVDENTDEYDNEIENILTSNSIITSIGNILLVNKKEIREALSM